MVSVVDAEIVVVNPDGPVTVTVVDVPEGTPVRVTVRLAGEDVWDEPPPPPHAIVSTQAVKATSPKARALAESLN